MKWFSHLVCWLGKQAGLVLPLALVTFGIAAGQPPEDRWERLGRVAAAHARHSDA